MRILRIQRIKDLLFRLIARNKVAVASVFALIVVCLIVLAIISSAPTDFPRNTIVRIEKNMTVSRVASILKERGIVRSEFMFKVYSSLTHTGAGVQAGSYLFDVPQSVLRIAYRTSRGIKNIQKIKITIQEGTNSTQIASLIKKVMPDFDTSEFLATARPYEGFLFPETYFIDPDDSPSDVVDMMREQFDRGTKLVEDAIATSTHSLEEIITMASIIEEEASNQTDRRIIAGILWKRIEKGMLLQVDAPFYYIIGKGSSRLTRSDLATTSPYNTYKYKGLPPGPISNPGLDAIDAALHPTSSSYYFYLADRKGVTHYATTHDGHVANITKYLQ